MTPKQQQVFAFICDTHDEKRYSPTYREIMVHVGHKSTAPVFRIVEALIKRGYLLKEGNAEAVRNLILTPKGKAANKREVCPHCHKEL